MKKKTESGIRTRGIMKTKDAEYTTLEAEGLADRIITGITVHMEGALCVKLRELKPQLEELRKMFKVLCKKKGATIRGCHNFKAFCMKRLGRSPSTVYEMMNGRKPKVSKTKDKYSWDKDSSPRITLLAAEEEQEVRRKSPRHSLTHRKQEELKKERIARLKEQEELFPDKDGLVIATGDLHKQLAAQDKERDVNDDSFFASYAGPTPDYKALLIEVLEDVSTLSGVPEALTKKFNAIRKRLGLSPFGGGLVVEGELLKKTA